MDDQSVGGVVRRYGDRDVVAGDHLDMKAAEPSADASDEQSSIVALNAKVATREQLGHSARNLQEVVAAHSENPKRLRLRPA